MHAGVAMSLTASGYTAADVEKGEMLVLFVDPAHSGRGIGRALRDAARDMLRQAGHAEVFLLVEKRNRRARAVYEAAGYRPDGRTRDSDLRGAAAEVPSFKEL